MPDKKAERPEGQMRRRPMRRRKKVCAFCADANKVLDYKDVATLKHYVSERGKILPRRITGSSSSIFSRLIYIKTTSRSRETCYGFFARAAMREDMESSQSCLHELRTFHVFSRSAATMPERSSGI